MSFFTWCTAVLNRGKILLRRKAGLWTCGWKSSICRIHLSSRDDCYHLMFLLLETVWERIVLSMQEMQEMWVPLQKDPLEESMATHSSLLAWEIPRTEKPGGPQPRGHRAGHDCVTEHARTWIFLCVQTRTSQPISPVLTLYVNILQETSCLLLSHIKCLLHSSPC